MAWAIQLQNYLTGIPQSGVIALFTESMQFGDGANRNMSGYDRISDLAP